MTREGQLGRVFAVDDRQFATANIRQSTCFPGATNTITAEFNINFDVTHRDVDLSKLTISISGLTSSSNPATPPFPSESTQVNTDWAGFDGVDLAFRRMGVWDETKGLMVLRTALSSNGIYSDLQYAVSWLVTNPMHAQEAAFDSALFIQLSYSDQTGTTRQIQRNMTSSIQPLSFMGSVTGDSCLQLTISFSKTQKAMSTILNFTFRQCDDV